MTDVVERFIRYVKIDTESDPTCQTCPSTEKQFDLARLLVGELETLGMQQIRLDHQCFVTAVLPANIDQPVPVVGFFAHLDTSPDMSGANVQPRLVENYDGGDIVLDAKGQVVLSPAHFPELKKYIGQTLITTDGSTLLGADDKAGIAEIMAALQVLVDHPEIPHGEIRVGFTPDEEIGTGISHFDAASFGADFAYTLDGGEVGELEYENFNATSATVIVHGRGVHPGTAKKKMINATLVAIEFNAMLPVEQRPEYTENYEGFYHLHTLEGTVETAVLRYIVREHDRALFQARKEQMQQAAVFLNQKWGSGTVELTLRDQYYNMRDLIEPVMHIVDLARDAMESLGIKPLIIPIRGGTDGAQLTYKGLPTPNIFTGGHNAHGKYEYVPVESMEKAVAVIVKIVERLAIR